MHSLGRDCHFNLSFSQEIPPLHASESSALSVYLLGNGLHLLASCYTKAGMHSLFFICAYELFVQDRGIFARMTCFLAGTGRIIVSRRKEMFNHLGWEAYWIGQAGMTIGVAAGALQKEPS